MDYILYRSPQAIVAVSSTLRYIDRLRKGTTVFYLEPEDEHTYGSVFRLKVWSITRVSTTDKYTYGSVFRLKPEFSVPFLTLSELGK